jgi:hypothetical protein
MKTCRIIFTCLSVILILSSARIYAQNTRITWYSFNMGYSEPNTDNTMIKSVVGQSFIGTTRYSDTQITSGFLADTLFRWMVVGVPDQEGLPTSYSLGQNYPNPFNPSTTIHFELPVKSNVSLKVYNILGQEIMTVLNETKVPGSYDVRVDGSNLSSGVYFYRLQTNNYASTKKFLLIK